jgi:pimeloyl-ACP methyl ester carboxylesterase
MSRTAGLALRASFVVSSRLTPRRAARRLADLWFTVPRRRIFGAPDQPMGCATRTLSGDNGPIRTRSWGTGPLVVFVHGWGGSGDQVHGFVEPLLRRGRRVVTFDAPGHGHAPTGRPTQSNALEMAQALRAVATEYGPIDTVLAHSLGAVATVIAIRHRWVDPAQLALVAPVTEVRSQLDRFADALAVGAAARQHLDPEVRRHTGLGIDDFAYSGSDPVLLGRRLLAVHDDRDQFVPQPGTAALVGSWPDARLITTHGLGHLRILADQRVVEELTGAIAAVTEPAGGWVGGSLAPKRC